VFFYFPVYLILVIRVVSMDLFKVQRRLGFELFFSEGVRFKLAQLPFS
jgi:hypothetical protein